MSLNCPLPVIRPAGTPLNKAPPIEKPRLPESFFPPVFSCREKVPFLISVFFAGYAALIPFPVTVTFPPVLVTVTGSAADIDRMIDHLTPLVDEGAYLPTPDHRVPPDVPLENYLYYLDRIKTVWGRGLPDVRPTGRPVTP